MLSPVPTKQPTKVSRQDVNAISINFVNMQVSLQRITKILAANNILADHDHVKALLERITTDLHTLSRMLDSDRPYTVLTTIS